MATMTRQLPTKRPAQSGLIKFVKSPRFARILFPIAALAFWYAAIGAVKLVWPFAVDVLPLPQEVLGAMWGELIDPFVDGINAPTRENLYATFGRSLFRLGSGFLIAMVIGTILGLAMGLSKAVDAFFHDWVMAVLAMPALAWALFLSLMFGFGNTGPILTVILAGIPFVIVNVREGVRNTPRELFDMARAFGVEQRRMTRHVLIPAMMPFFFAAIRYAFSIGWKGLVISEVFGGQDGAGWTIKFYYDAHRAHGVVAYAFFFIIFALVLEKFVFEKWSRRVFRWRPEATGVQAVEQAFDAAGAGAMASAAMLTGADVDDFDE
jgi:NitT/TauT family transport system permease protein